MSRSTATKNFWTKLQVSIPGRNACEGKKKQEIENRKAKQIIINSWPAFKWK